MNTRVLDLITTVVRCCEERSKQGPEHPKAELVRLLACRRPLSARGHAVAQPAGECARGQRLHVALTLGALGMLARARPSACPADGHAARQPNPGAG